ncbi:CGNR zinc finger domain-containing protein [soil metagenome]
MTGQRLVDQRGTEFFFDAGATCFDFAYTGGEGPYEVFEQLHEPHDLRAWLQLHVLGMDVPLTVSPRELVAAKVLRNVLLRVLWDAAAGRRSSPADVEVINAAAAAAPLTPRWDPGLEGAAWTAPVRVRQALSTLAREAIGILADPPPGRIRQCEGEHCPLTFLDSSRPGTRRWCAMERCGNRHKVRAHRERHSPDS